MSNSRYRQIVNQPPAVDFLENRMSNYHPAFDPRQVQWSPNQGRFIAQHPQQRTAMSLPPSAFLNVPLRPGPRPKPSMIDEMEFWESVLPAAMKQLVTLPEPQYGEALQVQWSIRHTKTWADVQAKLEMARQSYNFDFDKERTKGIRKALRRGLDRTAPYVKQGAKLVPGSDFTSPVVKVLDFVLEAYEKASEVRDKVESGFEDIPSMFADVEFWQQSFQNDENITQASIGVVLATLKGVEESMKFYVSTQAKRAGKALAKGEQYQRELVEALQEMHTRSAALHHQADKSFKYYMMTASQQARQDHWEIKQSLGQLTQQQEWFLNLFNYACEFLNGYCPPLSAANSRTPTPTPAALPPPAQISASSLLTHLQLPALDTTDLDHIIHSDADLHLEDRGRAQQVLSSPLFRSWLLSSPSAKLLVHGDFDSLARITPFSALSATLTRAFRTLPASIALVYFCGLHLGSDACAGPVWMARSLVAQLLEQYPGLCLLDEGRVDLERVVRGDVGALCVLLDALVRGLPAAVTVLCVIDGIHEYESREYLADAERVLITLLDLVESRGEGARVKLLLVSSQPTTEVRKVFDEEPGTLLHMQQLALEGDGMHAFALQERLESEIV